jgi:cytochrome c biogenesis protein CcdA
LGLIWSPCTGPTLGLAIGLASKAENLFHASLIFFFFGLGAGLGLITLGYLIKRFVFLKSKLLTAGKAFNTFAGVLSLVLGILILTGAEAHLQEALLSVLPDSLIQFSTQF